MKVNHQGHRDGGRFADPQRGGYERYGEQLDCVTIPWNPDRVEQRNGPIDRHGEDSGKVGPVIASQVEVWVVGGRGKLFRVNYPRQSSWALRPAPR